MAIRREPGGWRARVYRGQGKYEHGAIRPTRREAREDEARLLTAPTSDSRETCESFAGRWVDDYPRPRASTNKTNKYAVTSFAEAFKGVPLREVDRPAARAWALHKGAATVSAVRAMFGDALNDGLIQQNPFTKLGLRQSRGRKDIAVLTAEEVFGLADCALDVHGEYGQEFRSLVVFAAFVGLRPGELYRLERADIDMQTLEVRVERELGRTGEITLPKNGRKRTVILPPPARDALLAVPSHVDGLVFHSKTGKPLTHNARHYLWNSVRCKFGRPALDFYELRHFAATHLLELGCSHADVAVQLGHTDGGALVMDVYGHPSEIAARDRLKRAFGQNVTQLHEVGGIRETREAR